MQWQRLAATQSTVLIDFQWIYKWILSIRTYADVMENVAVKWVYVSHTVSAILIWGNTGFPEKMKTQVQELKRVIKFWMLALNWPDHIFLHYC